MKVTAQDKAWAGRIGECVEKRDYDDLAKVLAEFREVTLQCAITRVERDFKVKAREPQCKSTGEK